MKIKTKIFSTILFSTISLLFFTTLIFFINEKKTLKQQVFNQLQSISSLQSARLDSIIEQNVERLKLVASRTQLRISLEKYLVDQNQNHQKKMLRILQDAKSSITSFKKISIIALDGRLIASTEESTQTENLSYDKDLLVRSQKEVSSDTLFFDAQENQLLLLGGPLHLNGKLLGVIIIESDVENIISSIHNYSGLGESGEIIIAQKNDNGDALFLFPTRFDKMAALKRTTSKVSQNWLLFKLSEKNASLVTIGQDYRGQKVLSVAKYLGMVNWITLVKVDEAEAFADITHSKNIILLVGFTVTLIAIIIAYAVAVKITTPIITLSRLMGKVSAGDLSINIAKVSNDEVGTLSESFNEMIHKRKQAEEALHNSESHLRALVETIPDLIWLKDPKGVYLTCNRMFERFFGAKQSDIIGKTDYDFIDNELADFFRTHDKAAMAAGEPCVNEEEITYADDGHSAFLETIKTPMFDPDGKVIGVLGIGRDISERKNSEKDLADEKERLNVTLQSIGDGVITTDIDGNIIMINNIAEQLTGWTNKEAQGKPSSEVFNIINEKTGLKCVNPVFTVLKLGKIVGLANHTALIAKNGAQKSIADSGAPIRTQDGKIVGVVLVFRDVTQEKKIEEELIKIRKLESVGVLAGGIAHDFNNILTGIMGNIELASFQIKSDPKKTDVLLSEAMKATRRAAKLTQQLLTFSKGGTPVKETTSLPKLITESADFVLHGTKVSCDYTFEKELWLVNVDSGQISQVIQNIVLNAKHAMPEGGKIHIQCDNVGNAAAESLLSMHEGDFVRIAIQDTGVGIPQEILAKLFDPYFTTKQEGSGLGLAICHSIINKHDGQITVQSSHGKGTLFTIFLPAMPSALQTTVAKQQKSELALKTARIMVMDDEEMIRNLTKAQLSSLGHEVVLVENGEQAINKYQEMQDSGTSIDLVILDLTIPGGIGGQEAAKQLLQLNPEAKIIVASGYANDQVMANYQDYGFCAAVAKPFDLSELRKGIEIALA